MEQVCNNKLISGSVEIAINNNTHNKQSSLSNKSQDKLLVLLTEKKLGLPKIEDTFKQPVIHTYIHRSKEHHKAIFAFILSCLSSTVSFFHVNKQITPDQLGDTTEILISLYPDLSPDDFVLCSKTVKQGFIDSPFKTYVYDKPSPYTIDGTLLLSWFKTYYNAKIDVRENIIQRRKTY